MGGGKAGAVTIWLMWCVFLELLGKIRFSLHVSKISSGSDGKACGILNGYYLGLFSPMLIWSSRDGGHFAGCLLPVIRTKLQSLTTETILAARNLSVFARGPGSA